MKRKVKGRRWGGRKGGEDTGRGKGGERLKESSRGRRSNNKGVK